MSSMWNINLYFYDTTKIIDVFNFIVVGANCKL